MIPARVRMFVWIVGLAAVGSIGILLGLFGFSDGLDVVPAVSFGLLGLLAYVLAHDLAKAAAGSVAFIPWLAALFMVPSAVTIVVLAIAVALGEAYRRKALLKATFNVAQYSLAFSSATVVYIALGGHPLRGLGTMAVPAYLLACVAFFAMNGLLVAAVVGIAEGRSVLEVWQGTFRTNLVNDLVAVPVVFGFVAVYVRVGVPGIVGLAALMLGVRQLYKTNAQLQVTNSELLEVLVHAIELRDPYTSGHSQRVAKYSRIIGRAVGLSPKQIERLSVAALLHDVGKIDQMFVPILAKPGRLTPDERAIMELHPLKSAELVAKVTELSDIVAPVKHHHEAWDGSGYPDGLRGESIPLFARIIVFADTIDAMLTDRPYRKALGRSEVEAELRRCRGTQFDPSICDQLLSSPHFAGLFEAGGAISTTSQSQSSQPYLSPPKAVAVA